MRPGVAIALLLVVLLPGVLFVASAVRMMADREMLLEHRLAGHRQVTLRQVEQPLADWLATLGARLDSTLGSIPAGTDDLRALVRTTPWVRQALALDRDGQRHFPPPDEPLTAQERDFLERTRLLWKDRGILYPAAAEGQSVDRGWYAWYWGDEMNLIRWVRRKDGMLVGAELDPARLAADIIALLPDAAPADALLRLRNERGVILYQWGADVPDHPPAPAAVRPLESPLAAWRLEYLDVAPVRSTPPPFWLLGVVSLGCLLMLALAGYLYRAHRREVEIAGQRVSFVNQVSHELKTPLTNIRMYSELLERELAEDEDKPRHYLGVIRTESERLSRLIANVLSFARSERSKLEISPRPASITQIVSGTLETFRPVLDQAGIEVVTRLPDDDTAMIDADAVEQVLNNLVGNVEKYAAGGGRLEIAASRAGEMLEVRVTDAGPGIPSDQREKIFDAFHRVDDRLTGPAAGTGIGLSVARELARLHGGDLRLLETDEGACFSLTLHAPLAEADP